ncbi:diguanylate cyclase [Marinobacter lipolyticus]|uniref:sensor domain-containing diguanylate cyclase n=1 Tax=Marinobacter lipolyticus TaxID=209639 RepID=UPI001BCFF4E5|nr:diguanylate cyclase [Marinobacter lipolyticus]MBS8239380.1 diguanylate cyclase [Marinobacter lipolyticus]
MLPIILMGVLLSLSAYLIQTKVIYPAFAEVETNYAKNNIDRAIRRLESQRELIDFTVYDWSAWDDTYRFITDRSAAYIASNLHPDTFWNYGFDLAVFMDADYRPVWAGVYDFRSDGDLVDITETHLDRILPKAAAHAQSIDLGEYIDDQRASGIFVIDNTPVLFSMRPIVRSDGSGPHRGFILFGQFLSKEVVEDFSQQIVLDFSIEPVAPSYEGPGPDEYTVSRISQDALSASKLYSVAGVPSLTVSATLPRSITRLGGEITQYAVALFIVLCILIVLTLVVLVQRVVVSPIRSLRKDISAIATAMDYSLRTTIRNDDEIGALSREFNFMLELVESNNAALLHLNAELASEHENVLNAQTKLRIANKALKKQSETDALTGVKNRLALEKKLEQDWKLLGRTRDPLTVLLIDIDDFKGYNDYYGHQAGDECLKRVAGILQQAARRDTDIAARYGGEEFVIVLPGTSVEDARVIAAGLLTAIRKENIEHARSSTGPYLTLSIGIASVVPDPVLSVEALIRGADKALYQVKATGRNNFRFEAPPSVS